MDPEAYYELTLITSVAVAPEGDRVAFTADEFDPEDDERRSSLFVVPADGSEDPHRLSRASDAGSPKWSPGGRKLAFLAARDEDVSITVEGGDEEEDDEPESQVWIFDLERGGDARQVTDREHGVAEFDWAPDGERLAIAARDPTEEQAEYLEEREEGGPVELERLQHKFDGTGWLDDVRTYLFVVDVESRESRRLDDAWDRSLASAMAGLGPRWGPGGEIAFRANPDHSDDSHVADLHTVDPDGGAVVRHTDGDLMVDRIRWGPDGGRIAFVGRDPENWYRPSELYVLGDGEYRSLSPDLDRGIAWTGAPTWIDGETLLAPIGDEGLSRLARFHTDDTAPERVFDAQGRDRTIAAFDGGGDTLGVALSDPAEGLDCFAVDAEGLGEPTRLTRVNADALEEIDLRAPRRFTFENGDGDAVEGFASLPDDPEGAPLIAKIHGGPTAYDAPRFSFETAFWTERGYAVLQVNYRGSTSYGRAFSEAIRGEWGPKETHDVLRGVEAAVERGWGDPERLFVTGFSYGAMTTAHAVTTTDRFAAAAAEHGVYDYRSAFGTDDSHRWWENDFGLPWEAPGAYDRASSLPEVGEVETPLLVTAGGEDWRCPPSQSEQLYVSVRKQGVPARLIVYPDEHHDVGDPDRAVHRLEELAGWFAEHDPGRG